jgi:hypothetical protein
MSEQLGEEVSAEPADPWGTVRRAREPLAWILLACVAIAVLVSALQLFGLVGVPVPVPQNGATLGVRASAVAPQFVTGGIFLLPVVSVILVTFAGGLLDRARDVVLAAASIQAVTLLLGVVGLEAAAGSRLRPGAWLVFDAVDLVAVAAALVFTIAVLRSQALRLVRPQWADLEDDEEDLGDDDDFGAGDIHFSARDEGFGEDIIGFGDRD